MAGPGALLTEFSARLRDAPRSVPVVDRLLHAFLHVMGADGGAVTVATGRADRTVLAASDPVAERLEEVQAVVQQGPTVEAVRTGQVVAAPREQLVTTWPFLGEAVAPVPRLVCAYPMRPESVVIGAISVYSVERAEALRGPDAGLFLAGAVAASILGRAGDDGTDTDTDTDSLSWSSRDRVDHATGMVVAQLRVAPADALTVLRMHAFAEGRPLAEVARAVVERTLDFTHRTEDGTP